MSRRIQIKADNVGLEIRTLDFHRENSAIQNLAGFSENRHGSVDFSTDRNGPDESLFGDRCPPAVAQWIVTPAPTFFFHRSLQRTLTCPDHARRMHAGF
jgi:hypothetical protein